jgi:hypothetical protein
MNATTEDPKPVETFRAHGTPLRANMGRTSFLETESLDRRRGNLIVSTRFVSGLIPTIIAAGAIVVFAFVRYGVSVDQARGATIQLTTITTNSHFPLATRDAVEARGATIKMVVGAIHERANGIGPNLAPLVELANALPSDVRIKSMTLDHASATIVDGEALSYQSIVDLNRQLNPTFPATIATAAVGADPENGTGADARGNTWRWTGTIQVAPSPPPIIGGSR